MALYQGRQALAGLDEDRFPTLWEAAKSGQGAPTSGYDAGMEHLGLALGLIVIDRRTSRPPRRWGCTSLDRAHPSAAWPSALRPLARLGRGLAYASSKRHYAAEEELDAYLAELPPPARPYRTVSQHENAEHSQHILRGVGHLSRAWNPRWRVRSTVDNLQVPKIPLALHANSRWRVRRRVRVPLRHCLEPPPAGLPAP